MSRTTHRLLGILLRDRSSQAVQSPWLGLLAFAVLLGLSAPAFGQSATNTFGTGNGGDIYWAQSNGNNTVGNTTSATSSDPAGFSVDGFWNDTLSTGYNSAPVSPGTFPSINWSTVQSNSPVPATPPGTYPGTSPNPTDPGFIPGSTGMTSMPDVVFDAATGYNSPTAVNVNYSPTVYGIYVTNIGKNTNIHTDASTDPQTITLGNDGITVFNTASQGEPAGSAAITIGATTIGTTHYAPLTMNLLGSQTWQNNLGAGGGPSATSALQVTGPTVVDPSVTSPMTLTLSAPGPLNGIGTGGNTNVGGGAITDNTSGGGTLKLVITSGEWQIGSSSAPSSFTGGFSFDPNGTGNCWVKVASPTATGSTTATITVPSGDTYSPCTQSGNTGGVTFTNPLIISGVGVTAPGSTLGTTYGAIASMESNLLTNSGDSTGLNILAGGITLAGSALIEASNCPLNITTNAVNLNGFTLTLSGTASSRKILISAPIDDGGLGGGVTINSPNASAGIATTLSGTNNYSGATNVVAGTLAITGANSGGGAYAVSNGANNAVNLNTTGLVAASTLTLGTSTKATLSGGGTGTLSLTGNVTYAGASGMSASFNITNGTVRNGNSGSTAISIGNGGGVGSTISGTATIDTTGGNINWFGNIVGSTALLVVQGANTLSLNSGSNAYGGGTNINGGTVSIGANSAGSGLGAVGNPNGTVNLGDGVDATNASLVTGGNFTFTNDIATVGGSTGTLTVGGNSANPSAFSGASNGIEMFTPLTISQVAGGSLTVGDAINVGSGPQTLTFTPASTGTVAVSGPIGSGGTVNIVQNGAGTTTLSGANTFNGSSITVSNGTLAFNNSVAPTVSGTLTVLVASGATLELAGPISALGTAGGNRAHVVNNSTASGVVVSGTNQVVGAIDGSGNTQVNAGSDLTADHVIQNALSIGGTAGSPAIVTIDASDATGNPLVQSSGLALAESLTHNGTFGAGSISSTGLSSGGGELTAISASNPVVGGNPSSVPEPSTMMLVLLAITGLAGQGTALRRRARRDDY